MGRSWMMCREMDDNIGWRAMSRTSRELLCAAILLPASG